ncbi:hypothetical protein DX116_07785 [Aeromicrobium endophyticum]|uniref:Uncharacterized protein n=2 Tax=Aeromicrobium endophyticum TaxID=2292704 RepID=A0A371PD31_9ACTN|nr:hypothetical protein DX116_07785 [Aeromicrobium endophyticum]
MSAAAALALGVGVTTAATGSASAEPSGTYEYICVSTTGSSYSMAAGEKLGNCKGSYLQKYINGKQIESIPLDGSGTPVDPDGQLDGYCIIGLALGGTAAIVFPPAGAAELIFTAAADLTTLVDCVA